MFFMELAASYCRIITHPEARHAQIPLVLHPLLLMLAARTSGPYCIPIHLADHATLPPHRNLSWRSIGPHRRPDLSSRPDTPRTEPHPNLNPRLHMISRPTASRRTSVRIQLRFQLLQVRPPSSQLIGRLLLTQSLVQQINKSSDQQIPINLLSSILPHYHYFTPETS